MATYGAAMREGAAILRKAGIENPLQEAAILLQNLSGLTKTQLVLQENDACSDELVDAFTSVLTRRIAGEPVHRVAGNREFHSLRIDLNEDTLEPRDDTETLVEMVLEFVSDRNAPFRMADLGTGPGTVALALLSELPSARFMATDFSDGALDMARQNAERLGMGDRFVTAQGWWCEALTGSFDVIVSNPPYIPSAVIETLSPEVRQHDPLLALDGGEDGLDAYRDILANAAPYLNEGGFIALEIGYDQRETVSEIGAQNGWRLMHAAQDLNGQDRALAFVRA